MNCNLCPRKCGVDREKSIGYCGGGTDASVAYTMLHHWEEPCISGTNGSGTVFFSGCQLKCVYCQNRKISRSVSENTVTTDELADIFLSLEEKGAHNVNLVTPDHYIMPIAEAIEKARDRGLSVPIVYNTSGYVTPEALRYIGRYADVYLTDFKYMSSSLAEKYSSAPDYPESAKAALAEMVKLQPECVYDENGMMKKGVIVRHLIIPGQTADSMNVIEYLYDTYGDSIVISIMNQFTPVDLEDHPEINRRLTTLEYDRVVNYALSLGIKNAYTQEKGTAKESFIPEF